MEKTIKLLAVLLALQLLLALGVGLTDRGLSAGGATGPLLALAEEKINRITLEGPDQAKVVLAKQDGRWQLPDTGGFPADSDRVQRLIDRLAGLQAGAPVATSDAAQTRFKVADNAFEQRITLANGEETLAALYLGTSPGLRRTHARVDGRDAIHDVELAAYDVPVSPAEWEDKGLLGVPTADIEAIEVDGLRIERTARAAKADNGQSVAASTPWVAEELDADLRLKREAVERLAGQLADLRFDKVLGKEAKTEYGLDTPLLELTLSRTVGETIIYRLGKAPEKDQYTLKVSSRPEYFRLAVHVAEALIEAGARETLVAPVATENAQQSGTVEEPEAAGRGADTKKQSIKPLKTDKEPST